MSERIKPELVIDHEPSSAGDTVPIRWRRRRRRRWYTIKMLIRSWMLPVIIGVVALVVVGIAGTAMLISNAITNVDEDQARMDQRLNLLIEQPATDLALQDYIDLLSTVNELNASLARLDSRTSPFRSLASLAGQETEIQLDIIQARIHLTTGTAQFLSGLGGVVVLLQTEDEITADTSDTTPVATGRRMIEMLEAGQVRFLAAENQLRLALGIFDSLDQNSLSAAVLVEVNTYRQLAEQLLFYTQVARESPELLTVLFGIDEPHTYLVLVQNNDELLPSGGRINAWGWLRVRSGRIQDQAYLPTTADDPRPPAASVAAPFAIPAWWATYIDSIHPAWDGSLSPDFSETAAMALWYYNNGHNSSTPANGVIGIDLVALEYLMDALGQIYVPDYDVMVDAERAREQIYSGRAADDPVAYQQSFLAALVTSIVDSWQQADQKTHSAFNRALFQALQESHIKLYFADETVQIGIESLRWAGHPSAAQGYDSLLVAEANIQATKSSSSVYRQMNYDVKIEADGTVQSIASVFYDFPASLALADPAFVPEYYGREKDYEALIQVFTPAGSTFISGTMSSEIDVIEQADYTVLLGVVEVMYDDSTQLEVAYTNAYTVQAMGPYKSYRLLLQKQPGTRSAVANIAVQLPPGARVISASPQPGSQYSLDRPVVEFDVVLRQDEWIEIIYE
ncbi:MAG: DUF4012 domain-containing protein [Anaerolineae bacterium]|nr:DUF4012 domain-containing protein [Anaerolineae bacterium]